MTLRVTLHPGFHKTGTSSAQHFLWQNRARLKDRLAIYQLRHLRDAAKLCMGFSRTGNPLMLLDLAEALDAAFADAPDDRDILVTCEGLSGHLPGWPDVADYSAAQVTLGYLSDYIAERFAAHRLGVVLTTRDAEDWLYSAWRHHLIGQRLTEDWPVFSARLRPAADLEQVAAGIAASLAPLPVQILTLRDAAAHLLGPGGALLAATGHDPSGLCPVGHGNLGPDRALSQTLLNLNRGSLPDAELSARKRALCDAAGVGGWARGNTSPG